MLEVVSIKVDKDNPSISKRYPYVGLHRTMAVLFTAINTGMCILSDGCDEYNPGSYRTDWIEQNFKIVPELTVTFKSTF